MKQIIHPLSVSFLKRIHIFLSALAILSGGIIYTIFRTSEPLFFRWLSIAGFEKWLIIVRQHFLTNSSLPSEWIVYSLPNALWAFAYAVLITSIWSGSISRIRYLWMASIPVLVLGCEVLQYTGILPGTFCFQDMAAGLMGLVIGLILALKTYKPNHHETVSE